MSAIAGIYARSEAAAAAHEVEAMLKAMAHRGPDGHRTASSGGCSLGQASLWTTPEDVGTLPPCSDRSRRWSIVADGRLDNRAELLRGQGPEFALRSDAELILDSFERWGANCVQRLRGDFAFAVWDAHQRELFLARDHLGVRPLFYVSAPTRFWFASEMVALARVPEISGRPRWGSLALFLAETYTENGPTLYEQIEALPGGHTLMVRPTGVEVTRFWRPDPWRRWQGASDRQYAERFGEVFSESVRSRLRAHGGIGIHVSGGHDSSSVAVECAHQHHAAGGTTAEPALLRLVFPGLECDEARYSDAVATEAGLPMVTRSALADDRALTPHLDADQPDLYYLPTVAFFRPLLREARDRGIRAVLTGHGGDHLLTHTNLEHAADLRSGHLGRLCRRVGLLDRPLAWRPWRQLASAVWQTMPRRVVLAASSRLARRRAPHPPWLTPRAWHAVVDDARRSAERAARWTAPDPAAHAAVESLDDRSMKYCLGQWDRVAASLGLEHRHPFLDVRLVELALSLPPEQRSVPGLDKAKPVLRRAMAQRLPQAILARRDSASFECYIRLALLHHPEQILGLFTESRLAQLGLIEPSLARHHLQDGIRATNRWCADLMNLVALELWLRHVTR